MLSMNFLWIQLQLLIFDSKIRNSAQLELMFGLVELSLGLELEFRFNEGGGVGGGGTLSFFGGGVI